MTQYLNTAVAAVATYLVVNVLWLATLSPALA